MPHACPGEVRGPEVTGDDVPSCDGRGSSLGVGATADIKALSI